MAKIVKNNIDYTSTPSSASMLPYDNFGSGLDATNVQEAIDEIAEGGGGEGAKKLSDLTDVEISDQTVGQVLKYNGYKWANANESGGGGSSTFAGLTDVSFNNLQNGQVPKYNSTTEKWENANESGGGSIVTVTQIQSTGNKIATIGVDGVNTDLYSPSGVSSVSVTQVQSAGTKIGTINVDGNATDLYAPNGGGGASTTFLVTASHPNNPTIYSVVVKVGTTTVFRKDYSCTIYGVFSETTDTFTYDGITFTVVAQGYKANSSGEKMLDFAINSASRSVNCSASNSSYATTDTFTLIVTGGVLASYVSYDNTTSGLVATDVQDAIDEVVTDLGSKADASDVPEDIQDLDNVTITSATSGQILKYDGSGWVNANESTGSTVSVTQIQSTGTKIATISVDSVDTDLYAPNGGNKVIPNPQGTPTATLNTIGFDGVNDYYLSYGLVGSSGGSYIVCPLIKSLVNDLSYTVIMYDNNTVYTSSFVWKGSTIVLNISGFQLTIQSTQAGLTYYSGSFRDIYCDIYTTSTNYTVYSISGGGSGGHTIVDDAGTDLTQRTNLQFKGAYTEDNSTDDTTEVNVVREMTKAEFDLLSADEKVGFINITDITEGSYDRFQPVIYSDEEREIGVWRDGKPLYQKTIAVTQTQGESYFSVSGLNIDTFIVDSAYMQSSSGDVTPITYYVTGSDRFMYYYNRTNERIVTQYSWAGQGYINIRYTKTTDTTGSGQWTPQGVPAKHYSTVEHVIGTWADGSPLYERSYAISDSSFTTGWHWFSLGVVCDRLIDAEVELKDSQGTYCYTSIPVTVRYSDGAIGICNNMGGTMGNVTGYVTIRYIKTS